MKPLILASTSRYRRAQLERLGIPFEAHAPGVDEERFKAEDYTVSELAKVLAVEKAKALASDFPNALILGGDQIAEVDGQRLNKPETVERACAQLRQLSGRAHFLWTAIALHEPSSGVTKTCVEKHTMVMRSLSDAQIHSYVQYDRPLDSCGSYRIESLGISLFSKVEGSDFTAIVGVPLMQLTALLGEFGVDVFAEAQDGTSEALY